MKRTLVALVLGAIATASVTSSLAQGKINLDTYNTSPFPLITYGAGSGGTVGNGVNTSFTVGLYYALGSVSVAADPTGFADPSTLGPLTLATGTGSTTGIVPTGPGWFQSINDFTIPGYTSGTVTMMIVAYNSGSYAATLASQTGVAGHSAAFQITPSQTPTGFATAVGTVMPTFAVHPVPEPATIALAGLGAAALLLFRRRN